MPEITVPIYGVDYTVEYSLHQDGDGEMLTVYLPNGEPRSTVLRGLSIKAAATPHVRSYVQSLKN